jgi:hypothetical protein
MVPALEPAAPAGLWPLPAPGPVAPASLPAPSPLEALPPSSRSPDTRESTGWGKSWAT